MVNADNSNDYKEFSYDAWGRPRDAADWTDSLSVPLFAGRGFTGHEHLEVFALINMNGRIYDPMLGRFFSPDPYVQLPGYAGSYNRYSYCLNNPLIYTDPEGEFIFSLLASIIPGAQFLLPLAMAMDMGALNGGANASLNGESFWKGAVSGALIGGANSFSGGAVVNALNIGGILPGAAVGGLTGATVGGLGGGLSNWVMGGDFWDGAKRGALSGGIGGVIGGGFAGYQIAESGGLNYWWGTSQENWGHNRGQWSIAWWDEQRSVDFIANPNAVPYYGENTCVPTTNCMTHGDREFEFNSDNLRAVRMSDCNYENTFYQLDGYQQNGFKKAHLIAENYGEDLVGHEMAVHKVIYRSKNFWGRESFKVLAYDPGIRYYTVVNGIKVFEHISLVKYNFRRLPFSFQYFTLYNN